MTNPATLHAAVRDARRLIGTAYWSRSDKTRRMLLDDARDRLRDALGVTPPENSLLAVIAKAQAAQARRLGYRDAATRYNPERSSDGTH